jgi:hypothetical protein
MIQSKALVTFKAIVPSKDPSVVSGEWWLVEA